MTPYGGFFLALYLSTKVFFPLAMADFFNAGHVLFILLAKLAKTCLCTATFSLKYGSSFEILTQHTL